MYVLKAGLCAEFQIVPPVLDFSALDAFLSDELRTEARFGFVRIDGVRRLACSSAASQALLLSVLQIADQAELTRRLRLGMHRLTQAEYDAIIWSQSAEQDASKWPSARPQRVKGPVHVEVLNDARTPADGHFQHPARFVGLS